MKLEFRQMAPETTPNPSLRAYGFYAALGWQCTGRIVREDEVLMLRKVDC